MSTDRKAVEAALVVSGDLLRVGLRLDDERPDEVERTVKAIDFLARGDGHVVAIEHTQIGAFDDQERVAAQMQRVLDPICDQLDGALPEPWSYTLSIRAAIAPLIRPSTTARLAAWIAEAASRLSGPPGHFVQCPEEILPSILYREPRRDSSRQLELSIGVVTGAELESQRRTRLRRAAATKLPKLEAGRTQHNATETLFVIESPDSQISNAWDIAAALRASVAGLPLPDQIVLVETHQVWVLREHNSWVDEIVPKIK